MNEQEVRASGQPDLPARDEDTIEFAEGCTWHAVAGAFFIGAIMMPGSIYMGLIAGSQMGAAAEWVTIILFAEVARRSFKSLTKQEIYVIYYIAGGMTAVLGGLVLAGGPIASLIWHQYLAQSQVGEAFQVLLDDGSTVPITDRFPTWIVPDMKTEEGLAAMAERDLLSRAWWPAITVVILSSILSRISWFGMGYALFRLTSDVERLEFPLAPVAAEGATALAENVEGGESWRWSVFSIGMLIGLLFGLVYVGLPSLTGIIMVRPVTLLPIPWIEFTRQTSEILPAAPTGLATDLGFILVGFVLPYWVVVGSFLAAMAVLVVNPLLYLYSGPAPGEGIIHHWQPGMDTVMTVFATQIDFWFAFGLGIGIAVAIIGIGKAISLMVGSNSNMHWGDLNKGVKGRGDFSIWIGVGLYVASTIGYIIMCAVLLEDDDVPYAFLFAFGFLVTPLLSYVNARLTGLTGQVVGFPLVRQGAIVLSGYQGIDIWFAPIPYADYGRRAQLFRELELTGTRFSSVIKAELLIIPILIVGGLAFWSIIWKMNPIPSPIFQYAQKYWDLIALQFFVFASATAGGDSLFFEALSWGKVLTGLGFGLTAFGLLSWLGLPTALIYGFVRGVSGVTLPHHLIPEMFGALLGRFFLAKRFGRDVWRRYAPVLLAGYAAGMGLVGMASVAIHLIARSVTTLPY